MIEMEGKADEFCSPQLKVFLNALTNASEREPIMPMRQISIIPFSDNEDASF